MTHHQKKFKIKKFDSVLVIAGQHKGRIAKVLRIDTKNDRVFLSGLPKIVRHIKPNALFPNGVKKKDPSMHISNVSLYTEGDSGKSVPSKVRIEKKDGTNVRVLKKSNTEAPEHNKGRMRKEAAHD